MPKKSANRPAKTTFAAVICELNPPHFGHRAIFEAAKAECGGLVCILSGNFVQRGETAILDKWTRAGLALELGADLVVELPLPWACAGAERFAAGGVALAAALPGVAHLFFGSEVADPSLFETAARTLLSPEFSAALAALPETGEPFARRREQALTALLGEEVCPLLQSPNAILGVEYCKAILAQGAHLAPHIFPRIGAGHDEHAAQGEFCSASELRERLLRGEGVSGLVPEAVERAVAQATEDGLAPAELSKLETAILCKLRTMETEDFAALPDVSEGLEHRLYTAARKAGSLPEFYELAKSKRISHARIRRLMLSAFLGLSADLPALPPYLRVLGVGERGEEVLSAGANLPILSRPAQVRELSAAVQRVFALEVQADDLYALASPKPQPCGRDFSEPVVKRMWL